MKCEGWGACAGTRGAFAPKRAKYSPAVKRAPEYFCGICGAFLHNSVKHGTVQIVPFVRRLTVFAQLTAVAAALTSGACHREPQPEVYTVHGQLLAVRKAEREVVIQHDDVKGLMPAMTMPFKVATKVSLDGLSAGDYVTATLAVTRDDSWLTAIAGTGRRGPVPQGMVLPHVMAPPLAAGDAIPAVHLVDQANHAFTPADLRGHVWALTFVYTRCPLPTFCPTLERRFQEVQRAITGGGPLAGTRLVAVSLDPAYDRPPVLDAHARTLGANPAIWQFATGDPSTVDKFLERFGVVVERGDGSADSITHSMRTVVVDRDLRITRVFDGTGWTVDELIAALRAAHDA